MATPNIYRPGAAGVATTPVAVAASDSIPLPPSGLYLYVVENGGGSADTVVIQDRNTPAPPGSTAAASFADVSQSVAAGTRRTFLIDAARHRDPSTGNATVTHSFTTTVNATMYGPFSG